MVRGGGSECGARRGRISGPCRRNSRRFGWTEMPGAENFGDGSSRVPPVTRARPPLCESKAGTTENLPRAHFHGAGHVGDSPAVPSSPPSRRPRQGLAIPLTGLACAFGVIKARFAVSVASRLARRRS